jgi:hypothetical protein
MKQESPTSPVCCDVRLGCVSTTIPGLIAFVLMVVGIRSYQTGLNTASPSAFRLHFICTAFALLGVISVHLGAFRCLCETFWVTESGDVTHCTALCYVVNQGVATDCPDPHQNLREGIVTNRHHSVFIGFLACSASVCIRFCKFREGIASGRSCWGVV